MVDNYTSEASVDGNTGNFTVVLTSKPLHKVAMKFQVNNTGRSNYRRYSDFYECEFYTSQNIVFKAVDDSFDEGDNGTDNQTFVISISKICSAESSIETDNKLKVDSMIQRLVKTTELIDNT